MTHKHYDLPHITKPITMWAIVNGAYKTPWVIPSSVGVTRKESIAKEASGYNSWRELYRMGFRAVKVEVGVLL